MKVDTVQIKDLLPDVMFAQLTPMIHGSPGLGKSAIVRQIADHFNLNLITYILSNRDPVDIIGFPTLVLDKTRSDTAPPLIFPIEGDALPLDADGKEMAGWLLFFDEINSAPAMMQAASYHVILDKMVGNKKLHSQVVTVAAGNLETDNAIVNRLSTAMQSRLVHFELEPNLEGFLDWGHKNNLDYRVLAYIKFAPEALQRFDPEHTDNTFECPRTWEFVARIIKPWATLPSEKMPIIAGTVGEGGAYQFQSYVKIMESLPHIEEILKNPADIQIPKDPSAVIAIGGLISHHLSPANAHILMQTVDNLSLEFQTVTVQDALKRQEDPKGPLFKSTPIQTWIRKNAAFMMNE